jgi:hypothetical protein
VQPVGWVELFAKPITFSQTPEATRWVSQGLNPSYEFSREGQTGKQHPAGRIGAHRVRARLGPMAQERAG